MRLQLFKRAFALRATLPAVVGLALSPVCHLPSAYAATERLEQSSVTMSASVPAETAAIHVYNHDVAAIHVYDQKVAAIHCYNQKVAAIHVYNQKVAAIHCYNQKVAAIHVYNAPVG